MGKNAREKVLNNFTLNKFVGEYEDVYSEIMKTEKIKPKLAEIQDFS